MEKIEISVIIPTKNRAELLSLTLDSILKQTLSGNNFEVIIIDNGSSDDTKLVCDRYNKQFVNFNYKYSKKPGLHQGRNIGCELSNSDILVYADDDIEAFPIWLASILEAFKTDTKIGMLGGNIIPNWEDEPPKWILRWWEKSNKIHSFSIINLGNSSKYISAYEVFGCNFIIRKKIVVKAKGFHPDGMPQSLLYLRGDGETYISKVVDESEYKVYFSPNFSVRHCVSKERQRYSYIYEWHIRSGVTASYSILRKSKDRYHIIILLKLLIISFQKSGGVLKGTNVLIISLSFLGFIHGVLYYFYNLYIGKLDIDWVKKESYF